MMNEPNAPTTKAIEAAEKHSCLPFKVTDAGGMIEDATGEIVCQFWSKREEDYENAEANAAFVARACNSHEALLNALIDLHFVVSRAYDDPALDGFLERAEQAIAKAKGQSK